MYVLLPQKVDVTSIQDSALTLGNLTRPGKRKMCRLFFQPKFAACCRGGVTPHQQYRYAVDLSGRLPSHFDASRCHQLLSFPLLLVFEHGLTITSRDHLLAVSGRFASSKEPACHTMQMLLPLSKILGSFTLPSAGSL
jgi:hypothetical protein